MGHKFVGRGFIAFVTPRVRTGRIAIFYDMLLITAQANDCWLLVWIIEGCQPRQLFDSRYGLTRITTRRRIASLLIKQWKINIFLLNKQSPNTTTSRNLPRNQNWPKLDTILMHMWPCTCRPCFYRHLFSPVERCRINMFYELLQIGGTWQHFPCVLDGPDGQHV